MSVKVASLLMLVLTCRKFPGAPPKESHHISHMEKLSANCTIFILRTFHAQQISLVENKSE